MKRDLLSIMKSILDGLNRLFSVKYGSSFRINTIYMLRANVTAQVIVLLSTPLLSRLYRSDDFGEFAFFYAIIAVAVSVTTGRFDWSIPNSRSVGGAVALFQIGLIFIALTSFAALLSIGFSYIIGYSIIVNSKIGVIAYAIPLAMISFGLIELFNALFVRSGKLKSVGSVKVVQSLSNTVLAIICGFAKTGSIGLIISVVISSWLASIVFLRNLRYIDYKLDRTSKTRLFIMFKRYRGEAALSTAVSLLNALSSSVSIVMIASFFTLQELGWYALMQRLALAPIGLITTSIGQSFWSTAADLARVQAYSELRYLYLRTTARLCILIIPIIIVCATAPFFVGPLFGSSDWAPAGLVLLAMAPQIIAVVIFSPTNHLIVYNRQLYQLASDLFTIMLTIAVVLISVKMNFGIVACTAGISISILTGYIIRFVLHLKANTNIRNE